MAMVRVRLTAKTEIMGPVAYWYPGEVLEIDARQVGQLIDQYGDVFAVVDAPVVETPDGVEPAAPLAFGTAGAGAEEPAMAATGRRRK